MTLGNWMRTGLVVLSVLLTACDRDALQVCGDSCKLEITTTRELYAVGEEISFEVTLWTSEPRPVYLYDDPLCSIEFFSWLKEFEEQSIRSCRDVSPWLPWADHQVGSNARYNDGRSLVSYREAESVKTHLGPDRRITIQLTARTGTDESGRLMVWFAEDVYFAFSNRDLVDFGFALVPRLLASEPGRFSADYAIEFVPRIVDGQQYVSVTRKDRSVILEELRRGY